MALRSIGNRITRMFNKDIEAEDEAILTVHSISKQLLEELKHARRGLDANEIGHVRRELKTLIAAVKESDRIAKRAEKVWNRMKTDTKERVHSIEQDFERIERYDATVNEYLQEIYRRLGVSADHQAIRELTGAIESLETFAGKLHKELHEAIESRRIGHQDIAYRPPHHA